MALLFLACAEALGQELSGGLSGCEGEKISSSLRSTCAECLVAKSPSDKTAHYVLDLGGIGRLACCHCPHIEKKARHAKVVVWAHNSDLGDARASEMGEHGQLNLGQLVREQYGDAT